MPAANPRRRRVLADAAIAQLADHGAHGLTHRSVERRAGQPPGTASNYFRDRESLLLAAAERIIELHMADMEAATPDNSMIGAEPSMATRRQWTAEELADLLAVSLWEAVTTHRERYLAAVELQLAARGYPALSAILATLLDNMLVLTRQLHVSMGTPVSPAGVATLADLYIGALFTLIARPVDQIDRATAHSLASAMVHGTIQLDP